MKFVLFYHSALSDWNHGNAHFLRGVVAELRARGHDVIVYERADAWSAVNLVAAHGTAALESAARAYPSLRVVRYRDPLDLDEILHGADVVIVHEWNTPALVSDVGRHRSRRGRYTLLFHDTHHRSASDAGAMASYDLSRYDGVLAFGEVVRERYLRQGWTGQAWTWHEAADVRVFRPDASVSPERDLVWIGNWGDDERTAELREFVIEPVAALKLTATAHGVRYPAQALRELRDAGFEYAGWLANHDVPRVFARHRVTVHVPRQPYVQALPGIPTIRPFEALACGIPLVSAPWRDSEGLFRPGIDYLVARNGIEMRRHLGAVLVDRSLAAELARNGLETIRARHTCAHRVDQLLEILAGLREPRRAPAAEARQVSA